ncbi:hypothetical protein OFN51_35715, partial [Escherichia coli]|nr:hypothetical protein [Escherichia coli]
DVDVATNPVCFVPQTVAFLKRPISDSGLSESDHACNAFGVFFLNIVSKNTANRAPSRVASNSDSFSPENKWYNDTFEAFDHGQP